MQFVYPFVLWGLLAVTLPLLIHLFRLRKFRIVLFSSTRLLRNVQLETRKKSRIKHLIILLLRIFAIVSLVIAFARPFIPRSGASTDSVKEKIIFVYVDNSFSMEAGESYHSRLSEAQSIALSIAGGFSVSDRFLLFSNLRDASMFRPLSSRQFSDKVSELQISSFSMTFNDLLIKFAEASHQISSDNTIGFVISDFQHSFIDPDQLPDTMLFPLYMIPVEGTPVPNAAIDSVWFDSPVLQPGRQVLLSIKIRNHSDEPYENVPIELFVNESRRSVSSFDLAPNGETVAEMSFVPAESGIYQCYVEIQDSPVTFDDQMYFSFTILPEINVLAVYGKEQLSNSVAAIFRNEPLFNFNSTGIRQLQFGRVRESHLVILDAVEEPGSAFIQEINEFVSAGGSLLIIPPAKEKGGNLNQLMTSLGLDTYGNISPAGLRISDLNLGHDLFKGVFEGVPKDIDLPSVKKYLTLVETGMSWRLPLMKMQNGLPFLVMASVGKGTVYYFTSPFNSEFTDFYKHAIVVPVFYQIAFLSRPHSDIYYTIGSNDPVRVSGETDNMSEGNNYRIVNHDKTVDFIPQLKSEGNHSTLFVHNMIQHAGNYLVTEGDKILQGVSFNYSDEESMMKFYSRNQLDSIFRQNQTAGIEILESDAGLEYDMQLLIQGKHLWKTFLILALLFLAIEIILLRFWK